MQTSSSSKLEGEVKVLSELLNEDNFDIVIANSQEKKTVEDASRHRETHDTPLSNIGNKNLRYLGYERKDLDFLMDKLVNEQHKVLTLVEEIKRLNAELKEIKSLVRVSSRESAFNSRNSSTTPSQDINGSNYSEDSFRRLFDISKEAETTGNSFMWSKEEINMWKISSLPKLILIRKKLLSSLCGLSDAITRKRSNYLNIGNVMNKNNNDYKDFELENEAAIQASLHRLFGEAFYVKSVNDTRELHNLAETVSGDETKTFDIALRDLKKLTEGGELIDSSEKLQAFIYDFPSNFTPEWCKWYRYSMQKLLMAFSLTSHDNNLILKTRRHELNEIMKQEMFYTALLRAVNGRDIVPRNIESLSPEEILPKSGYINMEEEKIDERLQSKLTPPVYFGKENYHASNVKSLFDPIRYKHRYLSSNEFQKLQRNSNSQLKYSRNTSNVGSSQGRETGLVVVGTSGKLFQSSRSSSSLLSQPRPRRTAESLGLSRMYSAPRFSVSSSSNSYLRAPTAAVRGSSISSTPEELRSTRRRELAEKSSRSFMKSDKKINNNNNNNNNNSTSSATPTRERLLLLQRRLEEIPLVPDVVRARRHSESR